MVVRRVPVPGVAGTLSAPDYGSCFEVTRNDARSAPEWARAVWAGAPAPWRWALVTGWRLGLGLRLESRSSPAQILGWAIASSTEETIILEAGGAGLTCQNIVSVDGDQVRWTTLVRYEPHWSHRMWSLVAPVHHRTIPYLLTRAARTKARPRCREIKHRAVISFQRYAGNPLLSRLPGQILLETTGRRSGLPRRTPIGGARADGYFWFVSEHGTRSQYVRNIQADPRVRLRIDGRWQHGVAELCPADDPRARLAVLPRLNSAAVRALGTDLLTIRIALEGAHPDGEQPAGQTGDPLS
ncbi:MAG TPA: nitroreductase/quinone reductase family protein [Pseudonocardiaceae bacterium]|nr:nitroreductase/quinone reductase family protein [Pseudonocardiaceae bacterium]